MTPRGIRLNNPGSIRRSATIWVGQAPQQHDAELVEFVAPLYGLRAIAVILLNYETGHGLHSIRGIITRWAPPSENDTAAYVADVATRCGIGPDDRLDLDDPLALAELVAAIVRHENGQQPYEAALIGQAVAMALGRDAAHGTAHP